MSKLRVHELAKEFNITNRELLQKLIELDADVTNHMSGVDDETVKVLRGIYGKAKAPAQKPKASEPKKAAESAKDKPKEKKSAEQPKKAEDGRKNTEPKKGGEQKKTFDAQKPRKNNDRPERQERGERSERPERGERSDKGGRDNRDNRGEKKDERRDNRRPAEKKSAAADMSKAEESRKQDKRDKRENREKFDKQDKFDREDGGKQGGKKQQKQQNAPQFDENKSNKKNKKNKKQQAAEPAPVAETKAEDEIKEIQIGDSITVKELAEKIGKTGSEIVMALMKKGVMASMNQEIDFETAEKVCEDFDVIVEKAEEIDLLEEEFKEVEDDPKDLKERPPVVVVMGHVDHGKTSLLDAIRHSSVTEKEAGGITQHIGAYTVSINNKPITFLDTPGHEAFTAMRMRGAQVTDIAVLVVAADDGVMPQTIEAINHAKAAGVEIIVAINKIDKPSANPDRVKQELVEYGLVSEDWGGETICVPVSAVSKTGIDQLLEMILLVAELKELKANPNKRARGNIIEAQLDKGRGSVATVLVQDGTLNVGDPIVAGGAYGRIRAMMNDKGQKVKKAGPSIPVEILGLNEVPHAGDMFYVAQSEKHARQVAESVIAKDRESMIKQTPQKVSLDDLFSQIQSGSIKELNIVIKADVQGSVEAVRSSLEKLSNEEVRIRTIHGGVGAVTESDVMLASASNAIIIGFNVRPEASAKAVADDQKVDIRLYRVIYNAIEDITAAMKGMLDPVYEEKIIGHAEIRQLFKASGVGTIGGSYVTDGKFQRNAKVRIVRDGIVVYDGELATLRRFKDDVKEVNAGYECGLLFNKFNDIKEGDNVEAYVMEEIKR
ncbi:MAG: translation initiation factor IF-2 [Firmicutes bacterium]|nr:translation initiation factor IF-2 [Bacillota bacterium]